MNPTLKGTKCFVIVFFNCTAALAIKECTSSASSKPLDGLTSAVPLIPYHDTSDRDIAISMLI